MSFSNPEQLVTPPSNLSSPDDTSLYRTRDDFVSMIEYERHNLIRNGEPKSAIYSEEAHLVEQARNSVPNFALPLLISDSGILSERQKQTWLFYETMDPVDFAASTGNPPHRHSGLRTNYPYGFIPSKIYDVIHYRRIIKEDNPRLGNGPWLGALRDQALTAMSAIAGDEDSRENLAQRTFDCFDRFIKTRQALDLEDYLLSVDEARAAAVAADFLQAEGLTDEMKKAYERKLQAELLDWEILPVGEKFTVGEDESRLEPIDDVDVLIDEVMKDLIERKFSNADINWDRILLLADLRKQNGGQIYRSKGVLGRIVPYYALETMVDGETVAIAETPVRGNATYIVRESICAGSWKEVLALTKMECLGVGAFRVIHNVNDAYHRPKVESALFDAMQIAAESNR